MMTANNAAGDVVFSTHDLHFSYPDAARDAVHGVNMDVRAGEMLALLGPNGSGKSTLLRLLLGALRPRSGRITCLGRDIGDWPREEIARSIGVIAQAEDISFPLTVRELVAMGRYPHIGAWRRESAADGDAIERAMQQCGVQDLAARSVLSLSGGERQRARLARALAQEPATLLFDEPTAALDIAHEMSFFELMHELRLCGTTLVVVTHNINVASRYADRLMLLDRGRVAATGTPAHVLTRETVETVYGWPVRITDEDGRPQVVPARTHSAAPRT